MVPLVEADDRREGPGRPGRDGRASICEAGRFYRRPRAQGPARRREAVRPVGQEHHPPGRPDRPGARSSRAQIERGELRRRQNLFGISIEELELLLAPMVAGRQGGGRLDGRRHADGGAVATTTAACTTSSASSSARSPTRRSIRCANTGSMSLKTRYGNLGNVYDQAPSQTRILQLESPLLLTHRVRARCSSISGARSRRIDCTFDVGAGAGRAARRRWRGSAPRPRTRCARATSRSC